MKRNNIIDEIQEKDFIELQKILKDALGKNISYEKMQESYKILINNKDTYILGYYINDSLVGTVTLNILTLTSGKEAMIWDMAVKEGYRRLGIATKLMNKAEEIAKSYEDVTRTWLFSGFQRKCAHKLYIKLGYDENRDKAFVKQIK